MPPDSVTWSAILGALGVAGAIASGFWALFSAIKRQFERTREESEARTVRTHERIEKLDADTDRRFERLSAEIRDEYTPRDVHDAHIQRIDVEMSYLRAAQNCPAREKSTP